MRFETLVKSPMRVMIRFIEFVEPESANEWWLEYIRGLPRPKTPVWPLLVAARQAQLAEAWAKGQEIPCYAPVKGGP